MKDQKAIRRAAQMLTELVEELKRKYPKGMSKNEADGIIQTKFFYEIALIQERLVKIEDELDLESPEERDLQ